MRLLFRKAGEFFRDFVSIFKHISDDLEMYLKLDPAAESKLQVFFFYASFQGLMWYRFAHFFYKWKLKVLAYLIYYFVRVVFSMDIHPAARIAPGVVIDHGIGVVIGSTASVGRGTLIYHGVTLGTRKPCSGKRHPDVGENVMIGTGAKILGPIRVGNNAVVGANAVVLEDVPDGAVVVGVPARIVKWRRDFCDDGKTDREHSYSETRFDRLENLLETGKE
ncbi:serine acetyltransferase [Thermotoga maritima MSB8]|uniref:Serine acetyltransferase n=1 Tax=Thermotoga maritima (strain ATCC 43589 / DSM 3109 / JCM 10099 / NBRC 100826 / MSB8) TaxID=243274 RepID=Q9WZD4_THEMA|nr:serine O-acetyltransferase [Thermotoga maritima]AAD35754.1 serine acetyltransferase [Thermotoga maritima MSB8]AKE26586.1 serine acetyltransferase [Thermotoga maritima]AKE28451.1 serine acetyltransferase [Thermotoga maritima MSB8]AKE30324.1 serine acetyltransferase [Thermotoga maritima]